MFKYTFHKKVAETGNLEEFKKIYQKDSSLLYKESILHLHLQTTFTKNRIMY